VDYRVQLPLDIYFRLNGPGILSETQDGGYIFGGYSDLSKIASDGSYQWGIRITLSGWYSSIGFFNLAPDLSYQILGIVDTLPTYADQQGFFIKTNSQGAVECCSDAFVPMDFDFTDVKSYITREDARGDLGTSQDYDYIVTDFTPSTPEVSFSIDPFCP